MNVLSRFGLCQTQWTLGRHAVTDGRFRIVCGTQIIAEAGDIRHAWLIACAPQLYEALEAICASLVQQDDEGMIEHAPQMEMARDVIARLYDGLLSNESIAEMRREADRLADAARQGEPT